MSEELATDVHATIKRLCSEGDEFAQQGKIDSAILKYKEALTLIPTPLSNWEASGWVLAALGDMYFVRHDYEATRTMMLQAVHCPGGLGNPFLHLRLGQAQLELGNDILAGDELARAYMGAGRDIFTGEDPKYFNFLKAILEEPPGGW